jgi:DNA polymerase III delta prime subunit
MNTKPFNQERSIPPEFKYLAELIFYRIKKNFSEYDEAARPLMPDFENWHLQITDFIKHNKKKGQDNWKLITEDEATLLLLAIAPHIQPDLLDQTIQSAIENSGEFPQLGGIRPDGKNFRGFLPTGETALFVLGDDDYNRRLEIRKLFGAEHFFSRKKILWLEELSTGEPAMSGKIIMSQDYIDTFIHGKPSAPHFSATFPAKKIEEKRTRKKSLVISDDLNNQVNEIGTWIKYNNNLVDKWGMSDRLRRGYRALFYGPPGTGKTLTAGILGNELGKEVYKIDISMVVSKYIGETEKNLELLFARAEDKGWILFFDEADALFGKRTDVRDAHDKYANQEVSYLLQRIEDYDGLIILATNKKNNIDDAFIRRFNAVLKFSFPDSYERASIWEKSFPENVNFVKEKTESSDHKTGTEKIEKKELLKTIKKYELSGGNIINVVHYASLKATERKKEVFANAKKNRALLTIIHRPKKEPGHHDLIRQLPLTIYFSEIMNGIRKELTKEGKPFVEISS